MLVKLTQIGSGPDVNGINILCVTFALIFLHQKLQSQNVTREKLRKALLYKKTCMLNVDEIDYRELQ